MKPERLQLFSSLLEDLFEASTAAVEVKNHPGGIQIIKALHGQMNLPHDVKWSELPQKQRFSWTSFKDARHNNWTLVKADKGTGAFKAGRGGDAYEAIASTGGVVERFKDDRGGNIIEFLTDKIGTPRTMYTGSTSAEFANRTKQRSELKKQPEKSGVTVDTLINKFRPLWVKSAEKARADIKGFIINQIKSDSFSKAGLKIKRLEELSRIIDSLETGDTATPSMVEKAVRDAVVLAAAHYYPQKTGELSKGRVYGDSNIISASDEGVKLLLQDLTNGDSSKLGAILAYFRRNLVS